MAELNTLLALLLARVQATLSTQFTGMIVHGSLATGDFNPGRSDIDFVVVTDGKLDTAMVEALAAMHRALRTAQWADRLEGSYIPVASLHRYDPADAVYPALRMDGSFGWDEHRIDWIIQRHVIRESGRVLAGPEPQTLIDPVLPDDLRRAAAGTLREWWEPQLDDPFRLASSEYQAYAILTMCRAAYTIEHGAVVSKTLAAQWAKAGPYRAWAGLIERALNWWHGIELNSLPETLDLIRHTLQSYT